MVKFEEDGLPPPEPAVANGKDDGGDAEGPGEEVDADVPAGVEGLVKDERCEGEGVVDEREEDLE